MSIELTPNSGACETRPVRFSQGAWALWLARFRRRARLLGSQIFAILTLKKGARTLAPAAWAYIGTTVWFFAQSGQLGWFALPSLILFLCLGVAALIDARYFILPDGPLILLAAVGVAMRFWQSGFSLSPQLASCLAATAFAFASFRCAAWTFEQVRGYPGLGAGDARLFALAGLWLGWAGLPTCLIVATLSAALSAVLARRDGLMNRCDDPMPFGPHLGLGIWFCWSIGPLVA